MPNFGASRPIIAELDTQTNRYKNAFRCGELINTSITPQYNTASLYGDNRKVEEIRLFKTADIAIGVTKLPVLAAKIMFGHRVDESGEEVSNAADKNRYVGYAFITREMASGVEKYRACLLYKVKFNEGQEDYETQGENLTFKTPTISGSVLALDDGSWRIKSPYFDTEDAAYAWIMEKLGIEEELTEEPPVDNSGGTENESADQMPGNPGTTGDETEEDTY